MFSSLRTARLAELALQGLVIAALVWVAPGSSILAEENSEKTTSESAENQLPDFELERLQGQVVYLADAVKKHYGVDTDADVAKAVVVLQMKPANGQPPRLVPLLKEDRGRAFLQDKRLRNCPLELLLRRYDGLPFEQVIRVYALDGQDKFEVDYWCDICAITMYELKLCECCQGPIRLRFRPVGQDGVTEEEQPGAFSLGELDSPKSGD